MRNNTHRRPPWLPVAITLALFVMALGSMRQTAAAAGIGEKAATVAAEAEKKAQEVTQAAGSKVEEVWRRIDAQRLKNRTPDEIVAWVIMGLLVGGLIHQFSKLNKFATLMLGLGGAFLGGIIGNLVGLDLGMGPVLIRYEELVASLAGAIVIIVTARWFASRRTRKS